jgi:RIO-like serine/threonine protein kinase
MENRRNNGHSKLLALMMVRVDSTATRYINHGDVSFIYLIIVSQDGTTSFVHF